MNIRWSFIILIGLAAKMLPAQIVSDAQLWKGVVLQKSFWKERVIVSLNEEVRLVQNFSTVGNAYTDLLAEYQIIKPLRAGIGYRYSIRPEINTNRLYTDLSWDPKEIGRLTIDFRTRFQMDWSPVDRKNTFRQRMQFRYNLPKTKIEPFVSLEPFFRAGPSFTFSSFRWMAGIRAPLNKKVDLRLGYAWDEETDEAVSDLSHVFTVRINVTLDKSEDSKEKSSGSDNP
jgi:hypothetical protein